jgi:hypothetical protein
MSSKSSTSASCTGSYSGNTDNGFSGGSRTSVTVSSDKVSVTPSVTHTTSSGQDTFGGGISATVKTSDNVSVSASVHSHGGSTTGSASVKIKF